MSIARHHAKWISLLDISGPFLSMPVLMRTFPQGLDAHKPEQYKDLRLTYEDWLAEKDDPAIHSAWIKYVMTQILELPSEVLAQGPALQNLCSPLPEWGETLRPDFAVIHPDHQRPLLLANYCSPHQSLEKVIPNKRWQASPATRMMELLHGVDCPLGLLTNGEEWMLVHAKVGETASYIRWYAYLWLEEIATFRAFQVCWAFPASSPYRRMTFWRRCSRRAPAINRKLTSSWECRFAGRWRCWFNLWTGRTGIRIERSSRGFPKRKSTMRR
ncbi:MAG: hypothetical protein AB1656_06235 [Candidatus Omnitrophota bacterium]